MKLIHWMSFAVCLTMVNHSWAQYEEVGPIMGNPSLQAQSKRPYVKANSGTFDSTFIYFQDTIDLPVFDDFSSNKFQTYDNDYAAPNVTFDKVYSVLDDLGVPIAPNEFYTQQVTFRRTYNVTTTTFEDVDFTPTPLQIGSLASYPVTHIPTNGYPLEVSLHIR